MLSEAFEFILKLETNNNREWFRQHKPQYESARRQFSEFIDKLLSEIVRFDGEMIDVNAEDCIFRIYRDIRFSQNKDPYKTNFGAYMSPGGRRSMRPGYYLHIDPRASFIAGGSYYPESQKLRQIRQHIAENPRDFAAVIENPAFKKNFGDVESHGDTLVNVPKGFPRDHEAAKYLKYKCFIASREVAPSDLNDPEIIAEYFKLIKPLNDFLRHAIN